MNSFYCEQLTAATPAKHQSSCSCNFQFLHFLYFLYKCFCSFCIYCISVFVFFNVYRITGTIPAKHQSSLNCTLQSTNLMSAAICIFLHLSHLQFCIFEFALTNWCYTCKAPIQFKLYFVFFDIFVFVCSISSQNVFLLLI